MDMGEIIKAPRRVVEPMPAKRVEKPIIAPIFAPPQRVEVPVRRLVAVPVRREAS